MAIFKLIPILLYSLFTRKSTTLEIVSHYTMVHCYKRCCTVHSYTDYVLSWTQFTECTDLTDCFILSSGPLRAMEKEIIEKNEI